MARNNWKFVHFAEEAFTAELLSAERLRSIESLLDDDSTEELRKTIFECLPTDAALLICKIYGLGEPTMSLRKIAGILGKSRRTVGRQHDKAIRELRAHPFARGKLFQNYYEN